jgi:hypothetical protein
VHRSPVARLSIPDSDPVTDQRADIGQRRRPRTLVDNGVVGDNETSFIAFYEETEAAARDLTTNQLATDCPIGRGCRSPVLDCDNEDERNASDGHDEDAELPHGSAAAHGLVARPSESQA